MIFCLSTSHDHGYFYEFVAGFGTMQALGDMDFYPNGGTQQPGCPAPVSTTLEEIVTGRFASKFFQLNILFKN